MKALKNISLILLLWLTGAVGGQAQVSGTVTSSETGKAIAGAEVFLADSARSSLVASAETDKNGRYQFSNISSGSYKLVAMYPGAQTVTKYIQISGAAFSVNFYLTDIEAIMGEVVVNGKKKQTFAVGHLDNVVGTSIYACRKSEVIELKDIPANTSTNNARQVFARVAGLNIWESDAAGLQLGIGGRGLSPNRTSNFNTRQNGYDMSADALGYPESYYSPPTEAIERIEVVRGASSLQYGTQFGGMVNFKLKDGPEDKKFEAIIRQTGGSPDFYNGFASIGGNNGKLKHYTFYQYKTGTGFRPNSGFNAHTAHTHLTWSATKKFTLEGEYTYMNYLAQQPGGLTDAQFNADPYQSTRSRNWFRVNWNLAAVTATYSLTDRILLTNKSFGLVADKAALGFLGQPNRIDPGTERDLLYDKFRNIGNETRLLTHYHILGTPSTLLTGVRVYRGHTNRRQGFGSNGADADFRYLNPGDLEHSEYNFPGLNVAAFAEHIFRPTTKLTITPGIRWEQITTIADGYYTEEYKDLAGNIIFSKRMNEDRSNSRGFVLMGIGAGYKLKNNLEMYANVSQNYRAINFNDMRVVNPNLRVDPLLKDERGYSADLGIHGKIKELIYLDANVFYLRYNNRIGTILKYDPELFITYRYRTNISASHNYGIEAFAEMDFLSIGKKAHKEKQFTFYTSLSLINANYMSSEESAYDGKRVELVPPMILRSGLTWKGSKFKAALQGSYTAEQYTDATNSVYTANAITGIIPAYWVADISAEYNLGKCFTLFGSINNLTNNNYFTRRAEGYPGPGIIPADGRAYYVGIQWKAHK